MNNLLGINPEVMLIEMKMAELERRAVQDVLNKSLERAKRNCACNCKKHTSSILPEIKEVMYNGPATIVFWADNTKTVVVKEKNDPDNKDAALSACICKKMLGNKTYFNILNQYGSTYFFNKRTNC